MNAGFTLVNTHAIETWTIGLEKVWQDGEDALGKRPDSLTVELITLGPAGARLSSQPYTLRPDGQGKWRMAVEAPKEVVSGGSRMAVDYAQHAI